MMREFAPFSCVATLVAGMDSMTAATMHFYTVHLEKLNVFASCAPFNAQHTASTPNALRRQYSQYFSYIMQLANVDCCLLAIV
eukprot:3445710-Pleurochrysis_carterae.AAC.1